MWVDPITNRPGAPAMAVSVVICTYTDQRWPELAGAADSLQRQTQAPAEVIVVVDHNDDLLCRARQELPGVRAIPSVGGPGLSAARNTGIAACRSPIIAFLDDDAVPAADWLAELVSPYADASIVATGGFCKPAWAKSRPSWFPDEFDWVVGCSYRGLPGAGAEIRNPIGASMSIRRSALDVAGSFREDFGRTGRTPTGCDETELSIRLCRLVPGSRIVHTPGAAVAHLVPADRARVRYFLSRCRSEGLSKRRVTSTAGARAGLSSERAYATRTLPAGVGRGICDALRGDLFGLARSLAILAGLTTTAVGYAQGALSRIDVV